MLLDEIEEDETLPEIWANSSTDGSLAAFYSDLASKARANTEVLVKRSSVTCDGNHAPNSGDCASLSAGLRANFNAQVQSSPRNYCWGGCCLSWSASASFSFSFAAGQVDTCENACVQRGESCELRDVSAGGKNIDICVSNREDGCT
jgi:hypothetical protein